MPITLDAPITEPAKTASAVWVPTISISAPSPDKKVTATFSVVPWVEGTADVLSKRQKTLVVRDLYALAAVNPAVAQAVQALYGAIAAAVKSNDAFNSPNAVVFLN